MSRNTPSPKARAIAQQLVDYEAGRGDPFGGSTPAALRVSEKLRRPLSTLAGATGFRVLLARALTLARTQDSGLSGVQVKPDGSIEGLGELRDDRASKAGVLVIAELLGLLSAFIGDTLMVRLIVDVWPDLPALNYSELDGESANDPTR